MTYLKKFLEEDYKKLNKEANRAWKANSKDKIFSSPLEENIAKKYFILGYKVLWYERNRVDKLESDMNLK